MPHAIVYREFSYFEVACLPFVVMLLFATLYILICFVYAPLVLRLLRPKWFPVCKGFVPTNELAECSLALKQYIGLDICFFTIWSYAERQRLAHCFDSIVPFLEGQLTRCPSEGQVIFQWFGVLILCELLARLTSRLVPMTPIVPIDPLAPPLQFLCVSRLAAFVRLTPRYIVCQYLATSLHAGHIIGLFSFMWLVEGCRALGQTTPLYGLWQREPALEVKPDP